MNVNVISCNFSCKSSALQWIKEKYSIYGEAIVSSSFSKDKGYFDAYVVVNNDYHPKKKQIKIT